MIEKNPFKENGKLKAGFRSLEDGLIEVRTLSPPLRFEPAFKTQKVQWTMSDSPNIIIRILQKIQASELAQRLGISETYLSIALVYGYAVITESMRKKLNEIESEITGEVDENY